MGETIREQVELRERISAAEAEYAEALARFHADGKGARPTSAVPALEQRIQELAEDYAALEALLNEVLAEKIEWVETNRNALIRDAERESKEKRAAYTDAADRLMEAREELIVARRDELYFRLFPDASLASEPPALMLAGGAVARLRAAGFSAAFGIQELRRLLEADAEFVASMMTGDQRQAIRAREPDPAPEPGEATWAGTPEHQEQVKRERREAREAYRREWGTWPAW